MDARFNKKLYFKNKVLFFTMGALMLGFLFSCSAQSKARYFNKTASAEKSKPDLVEKSLGLKPGMVIADIGAGGGYFTLRFAKTVYPNGKVFAVDVNQDFLEIIKNQAKEAGLSNITTILAKENDSRLKPGSVDLVFMRNVFHHIDKPIDYFRNLAKVIKPGGKIAILDYKKHGIFIRFGGHYTPEEEIIEKMEKAGFRVKEKFNFLSKQSFVVFELP